MKLKRFVAKAMFAGGLGLAAVELGMGTANADPPILPPPIPPFIGDAPDVPAAPDVPGAPDVCAPDVVCAPGVPATPDVRQQ